MCKLSQTFYFCAAVLLFLVLPTKFLCFALGFNASHTAFAQQSKSSRSAVGFAVSFGALH